MLKRLKNFLQSFYKCSCNCHQTSVIIEMRDTGNVMNDYLKSSAGEKVLLHIISKNSRAMKNKLVPS